MSAPLLPFTPMEPERTPEATSERNISTGAHRGSEGAGMGVRVTPRATRLRIPQADSSLCAPLLSLLSSRGEALPYPGGLGILARAIREGGAPTLHALMHLIRSRGVGAAYVVTVARKVASRGRVTAGGILSDGDLRTTQGPSPLPEIPHEWGLSGSMKPPNTSRWRENKKQERLIYQQMRDLRRRLR